MQVADGRVMDLRVGRDGTFLLAGRSDGGNSPFFCGLRDVQNAVPFVSYDAYTSAYNMQSQAISNLVRVDASTGEAILGQQQLVRLLNTGGNTLVTVAIHADEAGNVYALQDAGFSMPNMANLTINGLPLSGPADASALNILSPTFEERLHWTNFAALGAHGEGGSPIDLDIRGPSVALLFSSNNENVQVGALPGSAPNSGGAPIGYLVVMPTVAA